MDLLTELSHQPEMGRSRPELGAEVRSFSATPNYGIFYSRDSTTLYLLRVIRFSRDIKADLFEP